MGENPAVGHHDDNLRGQRLKSPHQVRVLETLGLQHRQVPGQGQFLHRGGSDDLSPAPGPVRLGHHGRHLFPGGQDGLE